MIEHDATRFETDNSSQKNGYEYHPNVIKDPVIHKSKKARQAEENTTAGETLRTEKHCTFCKVTGHNSRTCQDKAAADKAAANTAAANNAAAYMAAAYMAAASGGGIPNAAAYTTQTQIHSISQSISHHMDQMQSQSSTGNISSDILRNNG
ncbi:hypothetical protein M0R45_016677 [Rubus argutus]|uniref:Uncharacterized protein n=1 Tax=Rubus argutus TaxID=59490 RepID=A0AAW1XTT7_RUBAR